MIRAHSGEGSTVNAFAGDINLDGQVDTADYSVIDNYYFGTAVSHAPWAHGNINYDVFLDNNDFLPISFTYGLTLADPALARVFQPAGMILTIPENTAWSGDIATFTDSQHPGSDPANYQALVSWGNGFTIAQVTADSSHPGGYRVNTLSPNLLAPSTMLTVIVQYNPTGSSFVGRPAAVSEPVTVTPAAPTGLAATATSTSAIALTWTNSSVFASGFVLDRSTDPAFASAATLTIPLSTVATTYTDTGLLPATHYFYRVRSTSGSSPPVQSASSNIADAWTAPLAPSGLLAAAVSDSQIDLAWSNDATDDGGTNVYISDDGVNFSWFDEAPVGLATYSAVGLDAGTLYWFYVTAVGGSIESSASNITSATTFAVAAPTGLSASFQSSTDALLTWADHSADETGFEIDWSNDATTWQPLDTVDSNTTEYDATNLMPGGKYAFRVVALAGAGVSDPSATSLLTAPPRAPWLAAVPTGDAQVQLTWDQVPGSSGYDLQRDEGNGWTTIQTFDAPSTTTYTDGPPAGQTTYKYRIGALGGGTIAYCDAVSLNPLPKAPTNLQAKWAPSATPQMELAWANNSSAQSGTVIERSVDGLNFTQLTITGATVTTYTDSSATPGPKYTYRVCAESAAGRSGYAYASINGSAWLTNGEVSVNGDTISVGIAGRTESQTQPAGIHGASTLLPAATQYTVTFDYDLSTWDSYDPLGGAGTGYWDSFSVGVTSEPYWQLTNLTDPISFPLVWGGQNFLDHTLESTSGNARTLTIPGDPNGPNYLNLVLDTGTTVQSDGSYPSWGTFTVTQVSAPPAVALTPYRTGGNFDAAVLDSVKQSGDPSQYVILTNNNYDEHPDQSAKDYDDNTAQIGTDHDLAKITLHKLPSDLTTGTIEIATSDPSAVRLFQDDGTELTQSTLDLSNPSGYLAGLTGGDINVWVEGLQADPDLILKLGYKDSAGTEVSRDTVHMCVADCTFVGFDGSTLDQPSQLAESGLADAVDGDPNAPVMPDNARFGLRLNGVPEGVAPVLNASSDGSATTTESFISSGSSLQTADDNADYVATDGGETLTDAQRSQLASLLQVQAFVGSTISFALQFPLDLQVRAVAPQTIHVSYIGGTDATDATKEDYKPLNTTEPFILKGYMLKMSVDAKAGTPVTWSIKKKGQNQEVGSYYTGGAWTDYAKVPLANVPTNSTIYWRSDTDGATNDGYIVTATYTDSTSGKVVQRQFALQSRLLDPNDQKVNTGTHPDVDMLQRAMIQDLFLDKGRLAQYHIGRYEVAGPGHFYTASNFNGALFSPIADEVWNFDKFTLGSTGAFGHPTPSKQLNLRIIQGIWKQLNLLAAAANPAGVTSSATQYNTWLTNAVAGLSLAPAGLVDTNGNALTSQQVLNAFVQHESRGQHSYALVAPLAFSSVNVGNPTARDGHYYTDDGIGFTQVQPYNAGTHNLYDPSDNLAVAAQIIDANVNSDKNPGQTAAERVWWAYYAYNHGSFRDATISIKSLRGKDPSAGRADDACDRLGLARVD